MKKYIKNKKAGDIGRSTRPPEKNIIEYGVERCLKEAVEQNLDISLLSNAIAYEVEKNGSIMLH